jgi:dienelactone hydrolase
MFPALLLLLAAAVANGTAAAKPPEVLRPTGPFAVGRISYEWTDQSRKDDLAPAPAPRTVKVHLFYPARRGGRTRPAPYLPDLQRLEHYAAEHFGPGYFQGDFGDSYPALQTLRGHALAGAPAAKGKARFPVVVFSHGGGMQALFYSALHEELASHGYIVAAIERPFDADLVALSDGRVLEQQGWGDDPKRTPAERAAFHRGRHETGARDNSFVLDQLERIDRGGIPSPLKGRLDLKHAAAIGHSLGGKTSVVSCARDPRWTACVNLDGGLDEGERYPATAKPVLALFGGPSPIRLPIETEEGFAKRQERRSKFLESPSEKRLLSEYDNVAQATLLYIISPGFSHFSYYDLLRPEAESWGGTPERTAANLALIRASVRAFLDTHLKGRPTDLAAAVQRLGGEVVLVPPR